MGIESHEVSKDIPSPVKRKDTKGADTTGSINKKVNSCWFLYETVAKEAKNVAGAVNEVLFGDLIKGANAAPIPRDRSSLGDNNPQYIIVPGSKGEVEGKDDASRPSSQEIRPLVPHDNDPQPSESSSERNGLNPGSDTPDIVLDPKQQRQLDQMQYLQEHMDDMTQACYYLLAMRKYQDGGQLERRQDDQQEIADLQKKVAGLEDRLNQFTGDYNTFVSTTNENFDALQTNLGNVANTTYLSFNSLQENLDNFANTTDANLNSLQQQVDSSTISDTDRNYWNIGAAGGMGAGAVVGLAALGLLSYGLVYGASKIPWRGMGRSVGGFYNNDVRPFVGRRRQDFITFYNDNIRPCLYRRHRAAVGGNQVDGDPPTYVPGGYGQLGNNTFHLGQVQGQQNQP